MTRQEWPLLIIWSNYSSACRQKGLKETTNVQIITTRTEGSGRHGNATPDPQAELMGECKREGRNVVLHIRRTVQAIVVAIIRSVKLFLQWAELSPVLLSTFQHWDWSIKQPKAHTANITGQPPCILLLWLFYTLYLIYDIINWYVLQNKAINVSQTGLKHMRLTSESYNSVVQLSLNVWIWQKHEHCCSACIHSWLYVKFSNTCSITQRLKWEVGL